MYIIIGIVVTFVVGFISSQLMPVGKTFLAACVGLVVGAIAGSIIKKNTK